MKIDVNCTRMLHVLFNKFWKQHPSKQQLYDHLPSSLKPYKLDEQDMWVIGGKVKNNSYVTSSYGPLLTGAKELEKKLELIDNSSLWTQCVV